MCRRAVEVHQSLPYVIGADDRIALTGKLDGQHSLPAIEVSSNLLVPSVLRSDPRRGRFDLKAVVRVEENKFRIS